VKEDYVDNVQIVSWRCEESWGFEVWVLESPTLNSTSMIILDIGDITHGQAFSAFWTPILIRDGIRWIGAHSVHVKEDYVDNVQTVSWRCEESWGFEVWVLGF
jgi:hypothetical protein